MQSVRILPNPAALIAVIASLAIPAVADDNVNREDIDVDMRFDRGASAMYNADTGGAPFFDNPYNALGTVSLRNVSIPHGTARIVGLEVEFDVDVCRDSSCKKFTDTLHYRASFNDTIGQASLNDRHNPDSLSVTGFPPGGRVHRSGRERTDTTIQFVQFTYTQTPTIGYAVNFTFYSSEFKANISVVLPGPPPSHK